MSIEDLEAKLPELLQGADHSEIWSISLKDDSPQRRLVLQKYLRAHNGDVSAAADGLLATLQWRKEFDPVSQISAGHDPAKFGGLGYVTEIDPEHVLIKDANKPGGGGRKTVVTWNIYGAVTDHAKTFGDVDEFLKWRVGLMERSVNALKLSDKTLEPPSDDIAIVQVHDYLNVSFLRPNPATRAATKKTIEVLAAHYPEMLSRKYFVNVPIIMGFMFGLVKPFVAKETIAKFQVLSYGTSLAGELGPEVPEAYGGKGTSLQDMDQKEDLPASEPKPPAGEQDLPTQLQTKAEEAKA